ncbi:MAG TPA: DNA polymerase IV [Dissulfurispiraceae bacterium]|nr:DNA polymerase IV [Dissulfurispiraceae bacterium]
MTAAPDSKETGPEGLTMRRILHMDMDAFFAAVEQKRSPDLIGKPVVIGGSGDPTRRGVVSTASYEARRYGIHSAMPLRTAYRLCPQAVFLPVDYKEYARVSAVVKDILRRFSPVMEDVGIDEAFLDISAVDQPSEEIALAIKQAVEEETGLTCSVGIAPNKLLAKIASDMEKPDGLTIIAEEDIVDRIGPLPVRKLWGVGPVTEARLKELDVKTIGELAAMPLGRLLELFGESYGWYLHESSRGVDNRPLVTHWEPKSSSRETTFEHDTNDRGTIEKTVSELIDNVAADLTTQRLRARTVTVKVRYSNFETHTRAKTLMQPSDSPEEFRTAALECLGRFDLRRKVRLIGFRASAFVKGD